MAAVVTTFKQKFYIKLRPKSSYIRVFSSYINTLSSILLICDDICYFHNYV